MSWRLENFDSQLYVDEFRLTTIEIPQENHYYAFGLDMAGVSNTAANPHSYTYNGKELQAETGWHDYGARMYDGQTGRWGAVDPLSDQMRRFSTYNYAFNNPIRFIDPDGMMPTEPCETGDCPEEESVVDKAADVAVVAYKAVTGEYNEAIKNEIVETVEAVAEGFKKFESYISSGTPFYGSGQSVADAENVRKSEHPNDPVDLSSLQELISAFKGPANTGTKLKSPEEAAQGGADIAKDIAGLPSVVGDSTVPTRTTDLFKHGSTTQWSPGDSVTLPLVIARQLDNLYPAHEDSVKKTLNNYNNRHSRDLPH